MNRLAAIYKALCGKLYHRGLFLSIERGERAAYLKLCSVLHLEVFAENVLVCFEDRIDALCKELVHLL